MKTKCLVVIFTVIFVLLNTMHSNAQYSWKNLPLGGGGFVSAVITCPTEKNLVYCRTDVGGAYKWVDASKSWLPLIDWIADDQVGFMGVEALAIDPSAPAKLYMLVGIDYFNNGKTAILRSNDYGATFTTTEVTTQFKAHGNGAGRQNGERLAVDPNKGTILFCGTRRNGLFKSTDAGATWTNVTGFPVTTTPNDNGTNFIVFDKTSGTTGNATQTIYAGVSRMGTDNIYVSKNGGTTWTALAGQTNTFMPQRAVLASDGNMFITYGQGAGPGGSTADPMGNGQVWKFNTKTSVWTNISPVIAGATTAFGGISVDASNPQKIIVTTINKYLQQAWGWGDRIFVSTNGGTSWTDLIGANKLTLANGGIPWIDNHAIHWTGSIEIDPYNPERVFLTSGNGLFMTENLSAATSTWTFTTKGLEETVPRDMISIPGGPVVTVIYDYDGNTYTDVTKYNATHNPGMGTSTGVCFAAKNTTYIARCGGWSGGPNPIYYSINSGTTWNAFATLPNTTSFQGRVGVSADGTAVLWCPSGSTTTYRTANNGTNWTNANGLTFNSMPVGDVVNANKIYAYNPADGFIYVSTDKGVNFVKSGSAGTGGSYIIRPVIGGAEGDIWIAMYNGGLTRTKNSGTSFTKIAGISACTAVGFGKAATGKTFPSVYIWGKANGATKNGLYRSDDEGLTWIRINDDQHQYGGPANGQFVIGDMNTYGRAYMSTAGRGIIYGEPSNTLPPPITITLGSSATTVCIGASATLTATPTVTTGTVSKVDFYDGTTLLGTDNTSPYTYTLSNPTVGAHTITAIATSSTAATATSDPVTITVTTDAAITPYLQTNGGAWLQQLTTQLCPGGSIAIGPQPNIVADWSWTGPNGFTSTTREIALNAMTAAQSGKYTATYNDGTGCPGAADFIITINVTPAPTVVSPVTYYQNSPATALTATGTALNWYNVPTGGTASTTAPIPSTVTLGTASYYVSQTLNSCEGARAQIDVITKSTTKTQSIALKAGWNLISINVIPTDSSIATLFNGLDVQEIKTMDAFWRKGQTLAFNGLKNIISANGYWVNMNVAGTLIVLGIPTTSPLTTTKTGWNLIGCPYQANTALSSLFNTTNVLSVKNFEGFWIPNGTTNSISTLDPGKGYFVKGK